MAKQKKVECPPGAPMWMTSYADMQTLILVFFVLMYSFAVMDAGKMAEFSASFRGNIDRTPLDFAGSRGITQMMGNGIIEFPVPGTAEQVTQERTDLLEDMIDQYRRELENLFPSPFETYFADLDGTPEQASARATLEILEDFTVEIALGSDMLFDSGSADLRRDREVLSAVAMVINRAYEEGDIVIVEGHTDSVPVSSGSRYRNNWELSNARAATVITALQSLTSLPGYAFESKGMSEYHPIGDNNTTEGRSLNRRVVIYIKASPNTDVFTRFRNLAPAEESASELEEQQFITYYEEETNDEIADDVVDGAFDDVIEDAATIEEIITENEEVFEEETADQDGE